MSLKANALKSNEAQKKSLMKEINSILGRIDDELKTSHDLGKHNISISLPITFSIPFMSNADSQRYIYYHVLKSLKDREFNVSIELQSNLTVFHVSWLTDEELKEIDLQNAYIAKHSKKNIADIKI